MSTRKRIAIVESSFAGMTAALELRKLVTDRHETVAPKEMGIILGVAVLLDAAAIRPLLLPVLLRLMGRWAWYLPPWAHRCSLTSPSGTPR